MPLPHFVDEELIKETKEIKTNNSEEKDTLEDYRFIANCLQIGLKIEDLKEMKYTDVAKILISFADKKKKTRKATQADWDKLAGRR